MKKNINIKPSVVLLTVVIIVFVVLLLVNETHIFKNDKNYEFDEAFQKQVKGDALNTVEKDGRFVNANDSEVKKAMAISNEDSNLKYMDISEKVPMSEKEVNKILDDKGILENQGKYFIEAQEKYEVNVIYLMSHALIETGNGHSKLAKGISEGDKTYYNFFGIGAFDENAVQTGKSYAQNHNWDSPSKAILGGGKFIRENYFENGQITLYQMRWNPQNPGQHQYASDIKWAQQIAHLMDKYYDKFGIKKEDIRKDFYL